MSAIDTLIAQISDPRLRERLTAEWDNAKKEKKFGLVFEDHLPELLPLHGAKPRKGDLVCRRLNGQVSALKEVWQIKSIHSGMATCVKPSNESHPSEPSLSDNFEKAVGLPRFAEKHGQLFGRIQLIRKQSSAGGEYFARLEINQTATIKKLLLINSNPLLDDLFASPAT